MIVPYHKEKYDSIRTILIEFVLHFFEDDSRESSFHLSSSDDDNGGDDSGGQVRDTSPHLLLAHQLSTTDQDVFVSRLNVFVL